jgi:hypothetical protein
MTAILVDHNLEGQSLLLAGTLLEQSWTSLLDLRFSHLADEGLPRSMSDRDLWHYAQAHGMVLLTANRRMLGPDTLEQTIREENTPTALPVLTIAAAKRMNERAYRERCANRLAEIRVRPRRVPRHWSALHPLIGPVIDAAVNHPGGPGPPRHLQATLSHPLACSSSFDDAYHGDAATLTRWPRQASKPTEHCAETLDARCYTVRRKELFCKPAASGCEEGVNDDLQEPSRRRGSRPAR